MTEWDLEKLFLIITCLSSFVLGLFLETKYTRNDCADAHLGQTDPVWWREAVALAEFRKREKDRTK